MTEYVGDKLGDDAQIDIALSTLWSVNDPAYKERPVGADLLLVLDMGQWAPATGQTVPSYKPCVQLFWLQVKHLKPSVQDATDIYTLDYGEQNTSKVFQSEQLREVDRPGSGSYGFYAQFANQIPFVPVSRLAVETEQSHTADLASKGVRFAEWLVERTVAPPPGSGRGSVADDA
jgi:hypothetical protein